LASYPVATGRPRPGHQRPRARSGEKGLTRGPSNVEPGETLSLTSAQLSSLIDGLDWRAPEQRWRPAVAG
jgi:hypothetical protein